MALAVPPKMTSTSELQAKTFKRGEKVRLVTDLPEAPVGTTGKVAIANGFTWNRYWIRLIDGRVLGHVDHGDLVRAKHYKRYMEAREWEAQQALAAPAEQSATAGNTEEIAVAAMGDDAVVNGVTIPAYLLQRSADARIRLGA